MSKQLIMKLCNVLIMCTMEGLEKMEKGCDRGRFELGGRRGRLEESHTPLGPYILI